MTVDQYKVRQNTTYTGIEALINQDAKEGYELFSLTVIHTGNAPMYVAVMRKKAT
jgi:hypothetical protein